MKDFFEDDYEDDDNIEDIFADEIDEEDLSEEDDFDSQYSSWGHKKRKSDKYELEDDY